MVAAAVGMPPPLLMIEDKRSICEWRSTQSVYVSTESASQTTAMVLRLDHSRRRSDHVTRLNVTRSVYLRSASMQREPVCLRVHCARFCRSAARCPYSSVSQTEICSLPFDITLHIAPHSSARNPERRDRQVNQLAATVRESSWISFA